MWLVQFVLFSMSVLDSFQVGTSDIKKMLPQQFLKAKRQITPHPDAGLNIYQVLQKYGYPVETHTVTSEDGYILRMQRIPRGRDETDSGKFRPAILLVHGMLGSGADWLLMGPNRSLAYMLADAGFDVWLGNTRGNTWSRRHVHLDPDVDVKKFWDFSFEDCGRYDLPAKIDFILETTGQQKMFYLGHSQGTSIFFAMASLRPEYNDKIVLMTAFAPVAYMGKLSSPLARIAAKNFDLLFRIRDLLNIHEFFGYSELYTVIGILACSDGSPFQVLCATLLFILAGFDYPQLEKNRLPILMTGSPAGISLKMLEHYGQEMNSGYFRQFDYGETSNLIKYKSTIPPNFNLSAVTTPIALYYGQNDFYVAVEDVRKLARELPNVVKEKMVKYKLFNHMDYIFAKNCDKMINRRVLKHLKKFINSTQTSAAETPRLKA